MAALAAFIGGLIASLIGWFAKYVTKRLAITAALISAIVVVTSATWAGVSAAIEAVLVLAPPQIETAADLFLPTNWLAAILAVYSNKVVIWGYRWYVEEMKLKAWL